MFKNYLKIAIRNLIKNKSNTFINVGGLTLGVACVLIIFLVIQYDLSFDNWHEDKDRIFRVVRIDSEYGDKSYSEGNTYPLAEAVENDISGIEYVSIVNQNFGNTPIISYVNEQGSEVKFKNSEITFVEPDYFNIFSYNWVTGSKENALTRPNTCVITESLALKLFDHFDVIGKVIEYDAGSVSDLEITGLVKDQPKNSDFPFTLFVASDSKDREGGSYESDSWSSSSSSVQTYVKLQSGVQPEDINAQFDDLITKYQSADVAEHLDFKLQPLTEIHFDSRFGNYSGRIVEKKTLFALGAIGFLLLITAFINFINLNTAIAVSRSKEVGLRKTLGSTRTQLTLYFLGETALISLISIFLGVGITELITPYLEPLLGFSPNLILTSNTIIILFLVVLFISTTIAAGWYPARYLSGFNPIDAIKNRINASYGKGITLRRSLIVIQFTITQILIIGTVIIASQIQYFQNRDLGYNKEALIEVDLPHNDKSVLNTFKSQLLASSSIENVTYSNTGTTSNSTWSGNYLVMEDTLRLENNAQVKYADSDFAKTYGLTILAGDDLAPSDTVREYLVNEAFAKQIGYGDNLNSLIGKNVKIWGNDAPIVGIVKDFNTQSLHTELKPVILTTTSSNVFYTTAIRINSQRISDALASTEKAFNAAFPDALYEYDFLDDKIEQMYEEEQRTSLIMNAFTLIAILIGCLGLYGLVSYMSFTKTKEIGVRKVLGATLPDILKIFALELIILTGISFLIAAPASWYFMKQWLADFAYQIELGVGIFFLSFAGTILIAALTVGYKSISAALANPVDSLKSE